MRTPSGVIRKNLKQGWSYKLPPIRADVSDNFVRNQYLFFRRLSRRVKKYQRRTNYGLIYSYFSVRCFLNRIVRVKLFFYDGAWIERKLKFDMKRKRFFRRSQNIVRPRRFFAKKAPAGRGRRLFTVLRTRFMRKCSISRRIRSRYIAVSHKNEKRHGMKKVLAPRRKRLFTVRYQRGSNYFSRYYSLRRYLYDGLYRNRDRSKNRYARFFRFDIKEKELLAKRRYKRVQRLRWRLHVLRIRIWHYRFFNIALRYFGCGAMKVRVSFQFFGPGKITARSVSAYVVGALINRFRVAGTSYRFINGLKRFRFSRGVIIQASGRFDRRQMAFYKEYKHGKVGVGLFRSNTQYSLSYLRTKYGICGIKVWLPFRSRRARPFRAGRLCGYNKVVRRLNFRRLRRKIFFWEQHERRRALRFVKRKRRRFFKV